MFKPGKMVYRHLGKTGLKVSLISFGNMINFQPANYEADKNIIQTCLENGINFFDTAEIYGHGQAESTLGKIFKELGVERENIVVATKIWTGKEADINSSANTNRKHIREGVDKSLERLQLEYVDVIYAHAFDERISMEEICRAFNEVIEEGKAFYWATSNWSAEHIFEAFAVCEKLNLHKPVCAQNQYHMLNRFQMEVEYLKLFEYGYGTAIWSPLAGGFLTGKYLDGIPEYKDGANRFNDQKSAFSVEAYKKFFYDPNYSEKNVNALKALKKIAEDKGYGLNHLAIAWTIYYKNISTAIIGARTVDQLLDNLKALELLEKFGELEPKVNKILDNTPTPKMNFVLWKSLDPIRPVEP